MKPIDKMLSDVKWEQAPHQEPSNDGLPYATHSGVLEIGDSSLRCYRLNDGRAIFDADDFAKFFECLK